MEAGGCSGDVNDLWWDFEKAEASTATSGVTEAPCEEQMCCLPLGHLGLHKGWDHH